jgi:CheY-like chemotaxis protein
MDQGNQESELWALELEKAFQPYVRFVGEMVSGLGILERDLAGTRPGDEPSPERLPAEPGSRRSLSGKSIHQKLPEERTRDEKRVLLMDGAEISRVLFSHYLKGLPIQLEFAKSEEQALEKCNHTEFDLLIVDQALMISNPDSFSKKIRLKYSGVKVVLLSTVADSSEPQLQPKVPGWDGTLDRAFLKTTVASSVESWLWGQSTPW